MSVSAGFGVNEPYADNHETGTLSTTLRFLAPSRFYTYAQRGETELPALKIGDGYPAELQALRSGLTLEKPASATRYLSTNFVLGSATRTARPLRPTCDPGQVCRKDE